MIVVLEQPRYFPPAWWLERFLRADTAIFLRHVQFSRKDSAGYSGQSDTEIAGFGAGRHRLVVPVAHRSRRIDETPISDTDWRERHLATLHQAYARAPRWPWLARELEPLLHRDFDSLADLTCATATWALSRAVGATEDELPEALGRYFRLSRITDDAGIEGYYGTKLLVSLVSRERGDTIRCGDTALDAFIDRSAFAEAGITVERHPRPSRPYERGRLDFEAGLSILDAFAYCDLAGVRGVLGA